MRAGQLIRSLPLDRGAVGGSVVYEEFGFAPWVRLGSVWVRRVGYAESVLILRVLLKALLASVGFALASFSTIFATASLILRRLLASLRTTF